MGYALKKGRRRCQRLTYKTYINVPDYEDYRNGQHKCAHRGFECADHMINGDIEQFLAEQDYSLCNSSWMAAPIDFVPVQFHNYGICLSSGEEMHVTRHAKLKDFYIYDSVQEVKRREQEELAATVRLHGEKVDDGYEWHFEGDCPIVAAYNNDEPCDIVILSVRMNSDGELTIIGDEKNDRGNEHEIEADDIFAGHMDFITSEIGD